MSAEDWILGDEEEAWEYGNEPDTLAFRHIVHETEKAILFDFSVGVRHWLPKSQITVDHEQLLVTMPEWLAITRRLR